MLWSNLSLKNRSSPLRVLIASKDREGSHLTGISGLGETEDVGTTVTPEQGCGPEENRLGEANVRKSGMHLTIYTLSKLFRGVLRWNNMQPVTPGAREAAQLVKGPGATKPDDLNGFPRPTWWKGRTHSHRLASGLQMYAIACMLRCTCPHVGVYSPPHRPKQHVIKTDLS